MSFEGMPGHDLINVVGDLGPVAAVRDQEAAERRRAYPGIVPVEPPEFGCAAQAGGAWRILSLGAASPRGARADLAGHLRRIAEEGIAGEGVADGEPAGDGGAAGGAAVHRDPAVRERLLSLADALGRGTGALPRGEFATGPLRFRIVRVPGFARLGDDGPEPARVTDADEGPPAEGPIDPAAPVGPADAALRLELLGLEPPAGSVPEDVRREAVEAIRAHPGVVLLPPYFTVMEDGERQWRPVARGTGPQDARDALAHYFRVLMPRALMAHDTPAGCAPPSPGELAEYARAADRIDAAGGIEFVACGRRFRIVRVIRIVRVGPDGPEPVRPSDEDR